MDAAQHITNGITAIRNKQVAEGRRLILEGLRTDPNHDEGWVWLARTTKNTDKKKKYLKLALKANPNNMEAKKMLAQYGSTGPAPLLTQKLPASHGNEIEIRKLLKQAANQKSRGQIEQAIELWVQALAIQADHPKALKRAVRHLDQLGYHEDAEVLIGRAIDANTQEPFPYQYALDSERAKKRKADMDRMDWLARKLVGLPNTDDETIIKTAQLFIQQLRREMAIELLGLGLQSRPNNRALLIEMGDLQMAMGHTAEGIAHYNRAVQLGRDKTLEKRLAKFPPILTDNERRSSAMAWREVGGIVLFFVFLALQDAGLSFNLGWERLLGLVFSLIGGYLFVTATSSPQQAHITRLLGGRKVRRESLSLVPRGVGHALQEASALPMPSQTTRYALGLVSGLMLLVAFGLVLQTSLDLLLAHIA
jgi:tetratricopeptide (TPR) repeat protein